MTTGGERFVLTPHTNFNDGGSVMAKNHPLNSLLEAVRRLEEQGIVGEDASKVVQGKTKVLERALATRNQKLIVKTITEISELVRNEIQR